jgi:hypothetical protein
MIPRGGLGSAVPEGQGLSNDYRAAVPGRLNIRRHVVIGATVGSLPLHRTFIIHLDDKEIGTFLALRRRKERREAADQDMTSIRGLGCRRNANAHGIRRFGVLYSAGALADPVVRASRNSP